VYPTAEQYRRLGFVLVGHGFEEHGRSLQRNAEILAHMGSITHDLTSEELERKIGEALRDRASAERLCRIFDVLNGLMGRR
jgi:hypothetical protein